MKLIHTADLHLESKLSSVFPSTLATARRRELLLTFKRLFSFARENGVEGILIAGDLFDSGRIPMRTVTDILSTVKAYPEIDLYYLCGNHDDNNLSKLSALPENVHCFGSDWTYYQKNGVTIAGVENMTEQNVDELSLPYEGKNIVLLHGQIASQNGNYLIRLASLAEKNIDYLALGHIHTKSEGALGRRGKYAYSGCLEGRGFDECGEKGFFLLDIEDTIETKFVPFASLSLHEVEVNLTVDDVESYDVEVKMERKLSSIPNTDMVKVVLKGDRNPDLPLDLTFLEGGLASRFRFARVEDETRLAVFADDYETDISLKGMFVRLVRGSKMTAERQDKILECGIRALRGEEEL